MRIECTQGCGAMLDVAVPPMPAVLVNAPGSVNIAQATAELEAIRAEADRTVGHAITNAVLAHVVYGCPAQAELADDTIECGATSPMGYQCNRQPGHPDQHEHQVIDTDDAGDEQTHTIASWPNLTTVP
jgi:hypothetical protein